RVARSYRLFIALTVGVLLATTFFAATNVAADVLSKDALNASVEEHLYDFGVESISSNWSVSDFDDLEASIVEIDGVLDSTHSSQFVFEFNNTGVNMTLAGLEMTSDLTSGMQLISGRSTLGPNETYIVSGSANESFFALDQIVQVEIVVTNNFPNLPTILQRNLTVAGYVYLPEYTRDSIFQKKSFSLFDLMGGGGMGALGFFGDASYNLMLADWDTSVNPILQETSELANHRQVEVRNVIHLQIDRQRYLDPYDIEASLARLSDLGDVISVRASPYEGEIISNLGSPLTMYMFTQLGMNIQFISLALPVFLLAYFTGTMVSDVGYNFRRREIGLLLTKGFQRHTIKRMFLVEGALVGGIAGAASIFLGTAAAYFVLGVTGVNIFTAVLSNMVSVILSIMVGMFLGLFSVWRPAGRASKLEILDALKQYIYVKDISEYKKLLPTLSLILGSYKLIVWLLGIDIGGLFGSISLGNFVVALLIIVWVFIDQILNYLGPILFLYGATRVFMKGSIRFQEAVVNAGQRFFGAFGNLATRNVKRNPARTASLVFIIALIVSYGVFASGSLYSQFDYIERSARYDVGADVRIQLNAGANMTEVLDEVLTYENVEAVTPEYHLNLRAGTNTIDTRGIRPDEWTEIGYWESSWFSSSFAEMLDDLGDDGIIISRDVAKRLELNIGDEINVDGPFGSGTFALTIVGLVGFQSIIEIAIAGFSFTTGGDYVSIVSEAFLNESMLIHTSTANVLVDTAPGVNGTILQEMFIQDLDEVYTSYSVTSEVADYQSSALRSGTTKIQYLAISFAIILAMAGVALVVLLTLREKDAEIALLSVRGFSKWQLFKTLLAEVMVTVLFALLLGLSVGVIQNLGQVSQLNQNATGLIRYQVTLGGAAFNTNLILVGVVFLAAMLPVWWASRRPESKVDLLRA
ncbi:MAG: FtsX-like permease family protein, partial [Candidatus Thorarchaeota archaeon]|nr:FtsX-like permease family protein [Candidatus Thorarchaeota archaeon]